MPSKLRIHPSAELYAVPLSQLQAQHPSKRLVIGAAIVCPTPRPEAEPEPKILIVRRAASESEFAGLYELPGGGAEVGVDATLLDTVVRETEEETGLRVTEILGCFEGFEYETKAGRSVQFNFLVGLKGGGEGAGGWEEGNIVVKLNPEEHDAFTWVGTGEMGSVGKAYAMSGEMEGVVEGALKALQELSAEK